MSSVNDDREESCFYLILISGRCGSTLLMHYLEQIPDVVCYPEFFVGLDEDAQLKRFDELVSGFPVRGYLKSAACSGFPDIEQRRDRMTPVAIGTKTKYGDLVDFHGLIELAGRRNFKVIPMYRHNLVKSAISRIRAQEIYQRHRDYNIPAGSKALGKMHVPLEEFDALLSLERRYIDDINSLAGEYFKDCFTVTYEDLMEQREATLDAVLSFLGSRYRVTAKEEDGTLVVGREGAPPVWLIEKVVKATSDDLSVSVENYDELKRHLAGTSYEKFLDADGKRKTHPKAVRPSSGS